MITVVVATASLLLLAHLLNRAAIHLYNSTLLSLTFINMTVHRVALDQHLQVKDLNLKNGRSF